MDDGTNMTYSINREKLDQASRELSNKGIDLWLIFTSEGSDPCLPLIPGVKTVGPGAFLIWAHGGRTAVCSSIDAQDVEESGLFDTILTYSASSGIDDVLRRAVETVPNARIAVNYSKESPLCDGLTEGRFRYLRSLLGAEIADRFESSEDVLTRLRSIKSDGEIAAVKRAIEITLDIYEEVFASMHVGMSEIDVGQLFVEGMRSRGVVNGGDRRLSMPIVMKERFAHRGPGEAVIEPGDLLIMDFSVDYRGYVSDIARTVYFLRQSETAPPSEVQDAFHAVHGAVSAAIDAIRPGVVGFEVDAAARSYLTDRGYPEITHATGHQVGREAHDGGTLLGPRWDRYGRAPFGVIEEGMLFTVEPTIVREGEPSFIVEDIVRVTADGCELLSRRQNELITIPYRKG